MNARREGCRRMAGIPVEKLYAMGFMPESIAVDIGWKLKCSECGHKGALTEPDRTTASKAEGAPRGFSCPSR